MEIGIEKFRRKFPEFVINVQISIFQVAVC